MIALWITLAILALTFFLSVAIQLVIDWRKARVVDEIWEQKKELEGKNENGL